MDNTVWFEKEAIKKGLFAEYENFRKGSTIFILTLMANQDLKTNLITITYKELRKQTGYSYDFIRKLLKDLEEFEIIKKYSKQGSRKTVLRISEQNITKCQKFLDNRTEIENNFIPGKWVSLYPEEFKIIRNFLNFRGLYAITGLQNKKEIFYIGRSKNVGNRALHLEIIKILKEEKKDYMYKIRKNKEKYEDKKIEKALIKRLQPKFNSEFTSKYGEKLKAEYL